MFFKGLPITIIMLKTSGREGGREEIKKIKSVKSGQHERLQKAERYKTHGTVKKGDDH